MVTRFLYRSPSSLSQLTRRSPAFWIERNFTPSKSKILEKHNSAYGSSRYKTSRPFFLKISSDASLSISLTVPSLLDRTQLH